MIECKGRNGYFIFDSFEVFIPECGDCLIEIYSKRKGAKLSAPITINGEIEEIKILLATLLQQTLITHRHMLAEDRGTPSGEIKLETR